MKRLALAAVLVLAGCGSQAAKRDTTPAATPTTPAQTTAAAPKPEPSCVPGRLEPLGTERRGYVGLAANGAVAYRRPGGAVLARFGKENVNHYPTMFGVIGVVHAQDCSARWYHVQLPLRPNGATGYVDARSLTLSRVTARIDVDLTTRRLTLYRAGRKLLTATVAIGSSATPTPLGRYYVNQRLVPDDTKGPYGPGAIGISAFSPVLTGWAQGGPIAIHGTNEPWSIGQAVSNGCVRLPNATLLRVFAVAVAGTPVIIHV